MNKVILLGRLTKAPEIKFSQTNNTKIANFTLAVNRKYAKAGEEIQADFINIVAFSKLADFTEKYLDRGMQICLCGRLQIRNYEDKEGQKRFVAEIIAEEIDFADSQKKLDVSILSANAAVESKKAELIEDIMSSADDLPF